MPHTWQDLGNRHRPQAGDNQRQAPSKSSCSLGLETRPELVWEDWDRGQEFTKTLVLKNIHNKLQKLYLRSLKLTLTHLCIHIKAFTQTNTWKMLLFTAKVL